MREKVGFRSFHLKSSIDPIIIGIKNDVLKKQVNTPLEANSTTKVQALTLRHYEMDG